MKKGFFNRNDVLSNKCPLFTPNQKLTIKTILAQFQSHANRNNQIASKSSAKDLSQPSISFRNKSTMNSGRANPPIRPKLNRNQALKNSKSKANVLLSKQLINIIQSERAFTTKKKSIKGRFDHLLNHSHVYNRLMYEQNDDLFHRSIDSKRTVRKVQPSNEKESRCASAREFHFKSSSDLFSKERTYYRYEDYYQSPEAFLKENFSTEELTMMITQPQFFKLKERPFLGSSVNCIENLGDLLNQEETGKVIDFDAKQGEWLFQNKESKPHKLNCPSRPLQKHFIIKNDKYRSLTQSLKSCITAKRASFLSRRLKNKGEEVNDEEEKNMLSSMEYDKLFEIIYQRKAYNLAKRQKARINNKRRFQEMKDKNMTLKKKSENEMNQTRLLQCLLEKNYTQALNPQAK